MNTNLAENYNGSFVLASIAAFVWAHFFSFGCGGKAAAAETKEIASAESEKQLLKIFSFMDNKEQILDRKCLNIQNVTNKKDLKLRSFWIF